MTHNSLAEQFCLCRQGQLRAHARPVFDNGRRLFECLHCGLHQLAPYPVAHNDDDSIYSATDFLDAIDDAEFHGYFRALYDSALKPLISAESRILDFGAGTCHYHRFLNELGHQRVRSLEINAKLVAVAKQRHGIDGAVTSFQDLGDEPFDLVYANQVMEHIFDPVALMQGPIASRLRPGGHLVLSLPNFGSLNRTLLGKFWIGYSPKEHIWMFDEKSLRTVIAGLDTYRIVSVIVHSAINTPHDRFRPRSALKRAYYRTFMRAFEWLGRGDQLIAVMQRTGEPIPDRSYRTSHA